MGLSDGFRMAVKPIPDDHHVVRFVPWARLRKDEDDNVIGVLGIAFRLRDNEEYLSTTWAEFFDGTFPENIHCAVRAIRASDLKVTTKSGFAIGQVGQIKSCCSSGKQSHAIRIVHERTDDNPAHAAVRRWPRDNDSLLDLLAETEWRTTILNLSVPFDCPIGEPCRCAQHRRAAFR
jgi:hypothetical protein